ncbi:Lrp/AsnC family transcriptional regulator [Phaeacidiphilus oryzae]|uniref:Lrp/AsnC family transcriptional regulator n=1 Tax=Phaeacidiphilus oryzae TaxID=348818 RepID=UPI00055E4603|nr:AsnC family transcriptional regulator [Phaeacidiphilus oryzae]
MDTDTRPAFAAEDQGIVQALQIDGRAPFRRIAEVLGVSDQTVARRYARLRGAGLLRVLGLTNPLACEETPWLVRVRCTPDAAASIADALARREDTSWVSLSSGGTEITCTVREAPRPRDEDHLLLRRLPRTPRVTDVQAHALLEVFFGQDQAQIVKTGPLTQDQKRALVSEDAPPGTREEFGRWSRRQVSGLGRTLDPAERRLAAVLARDGRASIGELAEATGWSPTTVRRRLGELRRAGVLYFDLELHLDLVNQGMRAGLWVDVEPTSLARAGAALGAQAEVMFAGAVTGEHNVYANVSCRDSQALYRYLTESVTAIPGIQRIVTAPVHRTIKGPGPFLRPMGGS